MEKISTLSRDIIEKHVPYVYLIESKDIDDFEFRDKVTVRYTHWMRTKGTLEEVDKYLRGARNPTQTPLRPECRVCHYVGYSNECQYSTESCPLIELRRAVKKRDKNWKPQS